MSRIAYYRVSTSDQSIEAQRVALAEVLGKDENGKAVKFDNEFIDAGVSGGVMAGQRPGFADLLRYVRKGDTVYVYAVDRLGRDALDVHATVDALIARGVSVFIYGLGLIGADGVGKLILLVLAQVAQMEKERIAERCAAGREAARASLAATGLTHRGKASLGRPVSVDPAEVRSWRSANSASISQTAEHFGVSIATVKRACAAG